MKSFIGIIICASLLSSTLIVAAPSRSSANELAEDYTMVAIQAASEAWAIEYSQLLNEYYDGVVKVRCINQPYIYEVSRAVNGGSLIICDLEDRL
jgi:hypothetical protein